MSENNKQNLTDDVDFKAVLRLRDRGLVVNMDSITRALDRAMDRCRSDIYLAAGTTSDRYLDTVSHDLVSLMTAKMLLQGRVQPLEEDE